MNAHDTPPKRERAFAGGGESQVEGASSECCPNSHTLWILGSTLPTCCRARGVHK